MASAIIKVKDNDGALDMDVEFMPDIDNSSLAHKLVQAFIIYINTPEVKAKAAEGLSETTA